MAQTYLNLLLLTPLSSRARIHPTYKSTTSGVSPSELGGKTLPAGAPGRGVHRRSVGELNGDVQLIMLEKGTTFIIGSWVYIADGSSGFNIHLAATRML